MEIRIASSVKPKYLIKAVYKNKIISSGVTMKRKPRKQALFFFKSKSTYKYIKVIQKKERLFTLGRRDQC
jgi:hypothetical protein